MPILIDQQTGLPRREVTKAEIGRLLEQAATGFVVTFQRDGPAEVRLYDLVDGTHTSPINSQSLSTYLRMVVYKCSGCRFVTSFDGGVAKHLQQVAESHRLHESAQLIPGIGVGGSQGVTCTGCGGFFQARKGQAQRHLQDILAAPRLHVGTKELLMKRYDLKPSGPVVLAERQMQTGPDARQVDGESPQRRRRRRRQKRG